MVTFLLRAFDDEENVVVKEVSHPVRPNVGDTIWAEGNSWLVETVYLEFEPPYMTVELKVDEGEVDRLKEFPGWKIEE